MLLHPRRAEYPEWWAGFHGAGEYATNPHPEHRALLAHCRQERIDAEIGKDNRLSATAVMEFEVPGGPARVLPLTLQGVLRISSVTDEANRKINFLQEARELDNDPWVILPEPAQAGKVYKLQIEYEEDSTRQSRIVHQQGPGLFYVTARESWFPSFGAFDDRTQYDLHALSPKRFTFVGTGHLVSSEKKKGSLETEWESEIPFSVVGFNYGEFVAKSQGDAELTVTAYSGTTIPDELKGVQNIIDTMPRAGVRTIPGPDMGGSGILTGGFNTGANARIAAGVSYQALKLFERYYGPLPFKAVSVTEQPVRGYGQSWPTLIFLPYDSLLDETTRKSLGLQGSGEEREFYNVVAVHEMSHQWWGHQVGWKTYHDQWLSEGFADFSAALYLRKFEPRKFKGFWDMRRKWLFAKDRAGHRPVDVGPLWLGAQLPAYMEERLFIPLVYYKGAYVLEMLRTLMEDSTLPEPDTRFISMMRDFVSTYAAKNASTEDFRRVVEKHMGQPMDWFFDQWIYGTEIPRLEFSYQLKDAPAGKTVVEITLRQSEVSDSFVTLVPFYLHLSGQARRLGLLRIKGSNTTTSEIMLPSRPEEITLDDNHSLLCKSE
jgi:aminopeptidase N